MLLFYIPNYFNIYIIEKNSSRKFFFITYQIQAWVVVGIRSEVGIHSAVGIRNPAVGAGTLHSEVGMPHLAALDTLQLSARLVDREEGEAGWDPCLGRVAADPSCKHHWLKKKKNQQVKKQRILTE